jgi:DNA polymerase III gamma/tau subunit
MSTGWPAIHRPKNLKQVVGQPDAVRVLADMIEKNEIPHALVFTGPSGVGKTSLARILASHLTTIGLNELNYEEINCASTRGIETARDLSDRASLAPMGGKARVFVLDEAALLTREAQSAFLMLFEEPRKWAYFFLCTTDPQKLLRTILTRVTPIHLKAVDAEDIEIFLREVAAREKQKFTNAVYSAVVEASEGSMRQALVLLEEASHAKTEAARLDLITKADPKLVANQIVSALLTRRTKWNDLATILRNSEDEVESLRRRILGVAGTMLLSGKGDAKRLKLILHAFELDFFGSGKWGLVRACHDVLEGA